MPHSDTCETLNGHEAFGGAVVALAVELAGTGQHKPGLEVLGYVFKSKASSFFLYAGTSNT